MHPIAIALKLLYIDAMNTDDPTKDLKDPADYETKLVMELLLERINAIGDEVAAFRQEANAKFDTIDKRFDVLELELREFREETKENLRKIRESIDILASDVINIRADIPRHEKQLAELEKAS